MMGEFTPAIEASGVYLGSKLSGSLAKFGPKLKGLVTKIDDLFNASDDILKFSDELLESTSKLNIIDDLDIGKDLIKYGDDLRISAESRANYLANSSGKTPTVTSVVKNTDTGQIYFGNSGYIAENIHPYLRSRMPSPSYKPWPVANCAEFNAVNNALLNGARSLDDLAIYTIRTRNLVPIPRCSNCKVTTSGASVLTD